MKQCLSSWWCIVPRLWALKSAFLHDATHFALVSNSIQTLVEVLPLAHEPQTGQMFDQYRFSDQEKRENREQIDHGLDSWLLWKTSLDQTFLVLAKIQEVGVIWTNKWVLKFPWGGNAQQSSHLLLFHEKLLLLEDEVWGFPLRSDQGTEGFQGLCIPQIAENQVQFQFLVLVCFQFLGSWVFQKEWKTADLRLSPDLTKVSAWLCLSTTHWQKFFTILKIQKFKTVFNI